MNKQRFPFPNAPEFGTTLEVAPGVLWLRMPLPMSLNHINLYLLRDSDGWYIVDTGMRGDDTQAYWEQIFANELDGLPIKAVIVTHMHPDHVGQAGWLCSRFEVPLYMTRSEFYAARMASEFPPGLSWTAEQFMRRQGATEERIESNRNSSFRMSELVEPVPMAYNRLRADDTLSIGGKEWRVLIGEGHSPEHACLYCENSKLMLSGDQIIAGITPNVSVMPIEPEGNPMAYWLSSLAAMRIVPDETLVLPSHKLPFYGLHERIGELIQHHEDHMLALEHACKTPQALPALIPVLFKRTLDDSQIGMAQGECLAHLHLMMQRGLVERQLADDGVYRYTSCDPNLDHKSPGKGFGDGDLPQMV